MASCTPEVEKEGERRESDGGGLVVRSTSTPWKADGRAVAASLAADSEPSAAGDRTECDSTLWMPALVMTGDVCDCCQLQNHVEEAHVVIRSISRLVIRPPDRSDLQPLRRSQDVRLAYVTVSHRARQLPTHR